MKRRVSGLLLVFIFSGYTLIAAQGTIAPENAAQLEQQHVIETNGVNALGWSQDGQLLLNMWSEGPTVVVYEANDYSEPVSQIPAYGEGENPGFYRALFNAMGTHVALVTNDGGYGVDVWDLTSGERLARVPLEDSPETLAIAPDGSALYYSLGDEQLYIIDIEAGEAVEPVEFEDDISGIVVHPGGAQLALNVDDDLVLYTLETGEMTVVPTGIGFLRRMVFHPNGDQIAVVKGDTIEIYDLESQEQVGELGSGITGNIYNGLAYHPDGTLLAAGGQEMLELYDTSTGERIIEFTSPVLTIPVTTLAFSPDGSQLAFVNPDTTSVEIWGVPQS